MRRDAHLSRLQDLLPDYVCGFLWMLAGFAVWSLTITPKQAREIRVRYVEILGDTAVPELAVGFLLILFGVLLPYAVAIIASPLSSQIGEFFLRRMYRRWDKEIVTDEHLNVAAKCLIERFGIPRTRQSQAFVLMDCLNQLESPLYRELSAISDNIYIRSRAVVPFAMLVFVAVFVLLDQTNWAAVAATVAASGAGFAAIHSAARSLQGWTESVIISFLVAIGTQRTAPATQVPPPLPAHDTSESAA